MTMNISWIVAAALVSLWLIALLFQLSDLGANWLTALNARDIPGRGGRTHPTAVVWMPPVASLIAVAVLLGADSAGRLLFDGHPWQGVIILLGLAVVIASVALGALVILRQRTVPSYALLREKLRLLRGSKLTKDEVIDLQEELAVIDSLHHRGRSAPASADGAIAATARANRWRLSPAVLGALAFIAVAVAAIGSEYWPLALLAVLLPVASFLLGRSSARALRTAQSAWDEVYQKQRSEAAAELDELERRASRGVPGLSDRVSRALRILREQQG
ncbi:MAG TPA: hypothetical protein VLZ78_06960 [Terrimesophilobacter sp.]|nr:hypothetical protein [Terrimesophilobacter sp.]